jgi:diaminopimelate decarboxylase
MGQGVLTAPGEIAPESRRALFEDAGLERRGASLYLSGVALAEIADSVGTPAYVYNADAIRRQHARLDAAFAALPHRICFAVKANSNLAVLRVLRDLGAGADIVSGGELQRALAAGFDPARIVFSGVGKSRSELEEGSAPGSDTFTSSRPTS